MKSLLSFSALLTFLSFTCVSQNPFCRTVAGSSSTQASNCTFNCNTFDDYLPLPSDSAIFIRLNFRFLKMAVTSGKFDNVSYAQAAHLVYEVNVVYDSLYKAQIRTTAQYIKRPRIQFLLNNFYITVDSLAYWSSGVGNFTPLAPYIADPNAIDVIFKSSDNPSLNGYGDVDNIPGKAIKFNDYQNSFFGFQAWAYTAVLAHELGHILGLQHINEVQTCVTDLNRPVEIPIYSTTGLCNPSLDSVTSNNIMSGSGCLKYLSPRQLAVCHYNIRNLLFNTLTPASQHYVRTAHGNTGWILSNQTWIYDRYMKGNIVVHPGATLTIKCKVAMQEGGRVMVRKGG